MVLNPCCSLELRTGVRAVVGVEFFTSAAFFLSGLITVQKFANSSSSDVPSLLFGIAYLLFAICQFSLVAFLLLGLNKNNYQHCLKWFLGSWILLIVLITFAACETYQGRLTANILWAKPVLLGFTSLLKLYCIWVGFEFMGEIRHLDTSSTAKQPF